MSTSSSSCSSCLCGILLMIWRTWLDCLISSSTLFTVICGIAADVIIKEPLKNLRMVEGETAKLQCKVKNPKNYPITWYRNGEEIKSSDKSVNLFHTSLFSHLASICTVFIRLASSFIFINLLLTCLFTYLLIGVGLIWETLPVSGLTLELPLICWYD